MAFKTWVNRVWESGSWRIAQSNAVPGEKTYTVMRDPQSTNDIDALNELHALLAAVIADEEAIREVPK